MVQLMFTAYGSTWRAEYGEINDAPLFRFGYKGDVGWEYTATVEWLNDLIEILESVQPLPVGQLTKGPIFQARKRQNLHQDVVVEPRSDTSYPTQYFDLYSEELNDLILTLKDLAARIPNEQPEDWDATDRATLEAGIEAFNQRIALLESNVANAVTQAEGAADAANQAVIDVNNIFTDIDQTIADEVAAATADIGALQDSAISGLLSDPESLTYQQTDILLKDLIPLTLWAEDFRQPLDVSDTEAWQRAVDFAVATPERQPVHISSRKTVNRFHVGVNWRGLKNVTIGGIGNSICFDIAPGAGAPYTFRTAAGVKTNVTDLPNPSVGYSIWGDSLTADEQWRVKLNERSGVDFFDGGLAGQTSTEIAFRMGALTVNLNFSNNQIVAGTNVATSVEPASYWRDGVGVQYTLKVILKGTGGDVPGTFFFKTATTPTIRFVPDSSVALPVTVGPSVRVEVQADPANKSGIGHEADNVTVWMGANDQDDVATFVRNVQAIDAKFTGTKLWIAPHTGIGMPKGSANYNRRVAFGKALKATVGANNVFDARSYITYRLANDLNLIPTAADVENLKVEVPYAALFTDTIHITQDASNALGNEIYRECCRVGLLTEKWGDRTENVTFRNIIFQGGASPVPDGVFDRYQDRTFGADYLRSFIWGDGCRTPLEGAMGIIRGVTIEHCDMYGSYTLPVLIRGAERVTFSRNHVKRCLDVGFTFTKKLEVIGNEIEWSADNGLSLSRGCSHVRAVGNSVEGSYYSGIMIGGFSKNVGPSHVTVSGNVITNSRMNGIQAIDGPSDVVISDNVIDGVLRGGPSNDDRDSTSDSAPNDFGTGISISGRITSAGNTQTPTVDPRWCENVSVTGNIVKNCDRNGIAVGAATRNVSIVGNTVQNIGSLKNATETVDIPPTHLYYNIGVGIYGRFQTSYNENIAISGNTVIDNRAAPTLNKGVNRSSATGTVSGVDGVNHVSGARA